MITSVNLQIAQYLKAKICNVILREQGVHWLDGQYAGLRIERSVVHTLLSEPLSTQEFNWVPVNWPQFRFFWKSSPTPVAD